MDRPFRVCALVPTYNNPATLRGVVEGVRPYVDDVVVVDDGSAPEGRGVVEALASETLARAVFRERNGGKGAAVKTGFVVAKGIGCTHAVQIDADGQHAIGD